MRVTSINAVVPSPTRETSIFGRLLIIPAILMLGSFLFIYSDELRFITHYSDIDVKTPIARNGWPADTPFDDPPPLNVNEDADLNRVLKEAATENKTIIMTTLNAAWANNGSIMDIFLESFRTGDGTKELLDHLVIVALDQKAYQICKSVHRHCFALRTEGIDFSAQKNFMTGDYLKMMWRRTGFIVIVIRKGYNVIFTDNDIMWFRDPTPHFLPDADFQIACDSFSGNPSDVANWPNGGYFFVRSNIRSIQFYEFWYSSRLKHPGRNEQDILNMIKTYPFIQQIGLKIRFLDTLYFGGFCQPSQDLRKVCTMHANCCIGLENKIHDLKVVLEDWRRFRLQPPVINGTDNLGKWSRKQKCW